MSAYIVFALERAPAMAVHKPLEVTAGVGLAALLFGLIFAWSHLWPNTSAQSTGPAPSSVPVGLDANSLVTTYSVYGSPGCLTPEQLEAQVSHVERAVHVSADRARIQIAAFIDRSVPPGLWVRFSIHPNEFSAWLGPPADHCASPHG